MSQLTQAVKVLPWGEEVYLEIPLHKKSANKFMPGMAKPVKAGNT
jgi:hypothetical protein